MHVSVFPNVRRGSRSPRISKNQIRTARIGIELSPAEHERIRQLAASAGASMSAWCRLRALQAPVSLRLDREALRLAADELAELTTQVRSIGVNVNQLAHRANQLGGFGRDVGTQLDALRHSLKEVLVDAGIAMDRIVAAFDAGTTRRK